MLERHTIGEGGETKGHSPRSPAAPSRGPRREGVWAGWGGGWSGRWVEERPEEFEASGTYLSAPFPSERGPKAGRRNQRNVKGFSPSSPVEGKGGAGAPDVLTVVGSGVRQDLCVLYTHTPPPRSTNSSGGTWPAERAPRRSPKPSLLLQDPDARDVVPRPRSTFVKVYVPATRSPARTLQSPSIRAPCGDGLVPRR